MDTKEVGVSWTPSTTGEYQIRVFVISNLTNPQVLSPVVETANFVVIASTEQERSASIDWDGAKYDIRYTLGSGHIEAIFADHEFATLSFLLEGIHKDTMLTLKVPEDLLFEVFSCGFEPVPRDPSYEVMGFTDTIPMNGLYELGAMPWEVPLQAGSEEVEFVGACIL